jgi:sarcosine oxidase delta subunit
MSSSSRSVPPIPVKEEGAATSNTTTATEECPICLDPVTERTFLPCCGKQICPSCYKKLFTQFNQATTRINDVMIRTGQVVQQQQQDSVVAEELDALEQQYESNSKCPMCRHKLPRDEHEVFQLVQQSANKHHHDNNSNNNRAWAQFQLGRYNERGIGTSINVRLAVKWYRKAAEQAEQAEQHEYGICLETGSCGVTIDVAEACFWSS